MIPRQARFSTVNLDSTQNHIDNLVHAAVVYAFDVPLQAVTPWSIISGDGIRGTRVVFHFDPQPEGNNPAEILRKWEDPTWIDMNPRNPLAACKRAFAEYFRMVNAIKTRRGYSNHSGPCVSLFTTRTAAALHGLGHPVLGWQWTDKGVVWKMHEASAADAALFKREDLYTVLPDASISYAKGALLSHAFMVDLIKSVTTTRHEHRGRVAIIGRNCPDENILSLEKILYRK
jgi:hypothetical protein